MADIKLMVEIPGELYKIIKDRKLATMYHADRLWKAVANGTLLTPDMLADMLMEERIRGKLKQDISYSKDIITDVKCRLTVSIRDHRPCYCGAELREVWRESEGANV